MFIEDLVQGVNIEDGNVEFKRILEEGKSNDSGKPLETGWLKTLVAFANSNGGTLYVGVDNKSHEVIPLDHNSADKVSLMVRRLVRQKIEPALSYEMTAIPVRVSEQTRYILKITVDRSTVLPVILHEEGLLGIYVREFSSSVLARPEQIRDLILMSDENPFDSAMTAEKYRPEDFRTLHEVYRQRNGSELGEKALIASGFMDREGTLSRGALLFRDNCQENTRTVCSLWPGINKGSDVILATEEFNGNILDIIEQVSQFVSAHSANGYRKEALSRIDFFSYPARSVTEGIVNATAHRNYYINGSQIEVNIFKDRLEITSPGSLLGVSSLVREKNISSIIPRRRNSVVCNLLVLCRYMESKGSGFDKIEEDYKGKGEGFRPFVSTDGNSFTLTLPDLTYSGGVVDETSSPKVFAQDLPEGKNLLEILSFCYMKPRSAKEIAEHIGIRPSSYFRKEVLGALTASGHLLEDSSSKPARFQSNHSNVFVQ